MNLRDQGYPSAKSYVPNRSDKRVMPMTDVIDTTLLREASSVEPIAQTPSVLDRLVAAYNNNMFGGSAPLISKQSDVYDDGTAYDGLNVVRQGAPDLSGRLGFAHRFVKPDGTTSYNVGLDNGYDNRGVFEGTLNTPLGNLTAGYEDDTNYLSYSNPNGRRGFEAYYVNDYMDHPIEASGGVMTMDDGGGKGYYIDANIPTNLDAYNRIKTPIGDVMYGANPQSEDANGYVYADYYPNQYVAALLNALQR